MAVYQLKSLCWVASWEGDTRDDQQKSVGPHYGGPASLPSSEDRPGSAWFHQGCGGVLLYGLSGGGFCMTCQQDNVGDGESRRVVAYQLTQGCWVGTCRYCGIELEDGEDGIIHHAGPDEVRAQAAAAHWDVSADGDITCRTASLGDNLEITWEPCGMLPRASHAAAPGA